MTLSAPASSDAKSQLRKTMGFWDVLLFNIATVLGPRWIAAAGHNGTSSISLWVIAALFFFVPGALVINELSSRFPEEGGLYAWSKEAFGDFHGFIAGWTYWIYTVFYFPGLLLARRRWIASCDACVRIHLHLRFWRLALAFAALRPPTTRAVIRKRAEPSPGLERQSGKTRIRQG